MLLFRPQGDKFDESKQFESRTLLEPLSEYVQHTTNKSAGDILKTAAMEDEDEDGDALPVYAGTPTQGWGDWVLGFFGGRNSKTVYPE